MLIANSVRPAPISPAMPTTSPLRTVRLMLLLTLRSACIGWYTFQSRTSKIVSPIFDSRGGKRWVRSRPTMPRIIRSSVMVSLPAIQGFDRRAVAQNRDRIGHLGDFVQFVGNENRGNTVLFELQQQLQQGFAVRLIQAGGRLIQNQQFALLWTAPWRFRPAAACPRRCW